VIPKAITMIAAVLTAGLIVAGAAFPRASASLLPNGTYRTTFAADQLRGPGIGPKQRKENAGTWTLKVANGKWNLALKSVTPGASGVLAGSYSGSGQAVTFVHQKPAGVAGVAVKVAWSFDGQALHFRWVGGVQVPAPVVKVVWTRHPWVGISS
jgi:hypothetical protein